MAQSASEHSHIFLVGHNPVSEELASYLTQSQVSKIPTCGIFCIALDISCWSEISFQTGKKEFFVYPKNLEEFEG